MQPTDAYSPYEIGLRQLLQRMGQDHPRYTDALIYQQRLIENITLTRHLGDTDTRKAERTEIIAQLNVLALATLRLPFTDLCDASLFMPPQATSDRPIPQNLPPRSDFIGRENDKALVHEALRSRSYLISIDGIGGIGKSSLALEVAYECLNVRKNGVTDAKIAIFEGFIWTTAKDRDLSLNDLLDAVARTLDYPGITQKPQEEKRLAVEKLLRMQSYLLIVDNFETISDDAVRDFLLNLPEPSKALITTREQKLSRIWAVSLKGLTESEALALIRGEGRRMGMTALSQASDVTLLQLYTATGGIPLALKWAVGQIKQKGQSLDAVLAALHRATGNIFEHIFGRSWTLLSEATSQVLMVMPLFATSASHDAIEATSNVHHYELDEALGQLIEMSLVEATDALREEDRRYSIHPLTRSFALAKAKQYPAFVKASHKNLAGFMQEWVDRYAVPWTEAGFKRLDLEFPTISEVIRRCWEEGEGENLSIGFHILSQMSDFLITLGYWDEAVTWSKQAISLAEKTGDERISAQFRAWPLSCVLRHRGNLDEAEALATEALEIQQRIGDERLAIWTKRNLGRIYQERGHLDQAEKLFREALTFAEKHNTLVSILLITANLATVLISKGDLDAAQELCEGVLDAARSLDNAERTAHPLGVLAEVAFRKGEFEKAKKLSTEAMAELKRVGRQDFIAFNLVQLAKIEIALGNVKTARRQLTEALESYRRLSVPSKVQETQALLANLTDTDIE